MSLLNARRTCLRHRLRSLCGGTAPGPAQTQRRRPGPGCIRPVMGHAAGGVMCQSPIQGLRHTPALGMGGGGGQRPHESEVADHHHPLPPPWGTACLVRCMWAHVLDSGPGPTPLRGPKGDQFWDWKVCSALGVLWLCSVNDVRLQWPHAGQPPTSRHAMVGSSNRLY